MLLVAKSVRYLTGSASGLVNAPNGALTIFLLKHFDSTTAFLDLTFFVNIEISPYGIFLDLGIFGAYPPPPLSGAPET